MISKYLWWEKWGKCVVKKEKKTKVCFLKNEKKLTNGNTTSMKVHWSVTLSYKLGKVGPLRSTPLLKDIKGPYITHTFIETNKSHSVKYMLYTTNSFFFLCMFVWVRSYSMGSVKHLFYFLMLQKCQKFSRI